MNAVPPVLGDLAARLAEPGGGARVVRGRPGRGGRAAAVLILFSGPPGAGAKDLEVVIVEKSAHLRKHAGQCAFPEAVFVFPVIDDKMILFLFCSP